MFRNYQELFVSCVDFYSASFFGRAPEVAATQNFADETLERRQLFAVTPEHYHDFNLNNLICCNQSNDVAAGDQISEQQQKQPNHHHHQSEFAFKQLESSLVNIEKYLKLGNRLGAYKFNSSSTSDPDIGSRLVDDDGTEITIGSFNRLKPGDVAHIICVFVLLLLAKRLLVTKLASLTKLKQLCISIKDRERLDECVWRLIFYLFSSTWLIYTCFIRQSSHLLFTGSNADPSVQLYSFQVDWWSYTICMIETSFYLHATYALIREDVWRRDSPMMLVHHLAAVFSILSIYATRDTCDVLLEVTKLMKCLYIQRGRRVRSLNLAIKFSLTIFTLAFAINQLYYYPLFCLYHALNIIKVYRLQSPVMVGIITCGLVFLLLDCLWFLLILRLLYYIVLSGGKLKDIREYEDEDEIEDEEKLQEERAKLE